MSHITMRESPDCNQQIVDLAALQRACQRCGLEFKAGQTTFRTWASDHGGRTVGDTPLPAGFDSVADLEGNCRHAVSIPGDLRAYEIGVLASKQHPGTFCLAYDSWDQKLEPRAGPELDKLRMLYQVEAVRTKATAMGDIFQEQSLDDGGVVVRVETAVRLGQ